MVSRMMGVALAAVSMCALAAGVQRAEAATYEISTLGAYGNDNYFTFDLSYDPLDRFNSTVSFLYYAVGNPVPNGAFTDTHAGVSLSKLYSDQSGVGYHLIISDPSFRYSFDQYNFVFDTTTTQYRVGYNLTADIFFTTPLASSVILYSDTPFEGAAMTYPGQAAQLGGVLVTTVPLPASLPLFGAGLLVLGGAAFARRRDVKATPPVPRQG